MKITSNPATGELTFHIPDDQAVDLLRELIAGSKDTASGSIMAVEESLVLATPINGHRPPHTTVRSGSAVSLSPALYQMWSFIVDNDNPRGIGITAAAKGLRITPQAAGQRMQVLTRLGATDRIGRGRYRATDTVVEEGGEE